MNNNNMFYDKDFRNKLQLDPKSAIASLSSTLSNDIDIVVKKNTKNILFFVMPADTSKTNDELLGINAAGTSTAGSAGTVSSGGSIGSVTSTFGSVGSLGSASSTSTAT